MHEINIETHSDEGPMDLASVDSLEAAFTCVRTLVTDHSTPIKEITISLNDGHRLVEGEVKFSAAWR